MRLVMPVPHWGQPEAANPARRPVLMRPRARTDRQHRKFLHVAVGKSLTGVV